jgi:predicted RNA-binding Zn-ribbon protein involved in translation (DUF1610 family)
VIGRAEGEEYEMMQQWRRTNSCENLNHRRANAPVRHCPGCGGVVNDRVRAQQCSETQHAAARRERSVFCADCGTQLIANG